MLYVSIHGLVGGLTSLYLFLLYCYSQHLYVLAYENESLDALWKFFWVVHLASWIFQFVGHGVFEGRKPALTDNLLLSLVAPFFVTAEVLFFCGWEKEMFEEIDADIKAKIKVFRESKNVKSK